MLRIRSFRINFTIAAIVALFVFLGWLSRSCSVPEIRFPPAGAPVPFIPLLLLDPLEVATFAGISISFILLAWPVIKEVGLLAMIVCGVMFVAVCVAEWYVLAHYILPHYFGCSAG